MWSPWAWALALAAPLTLLVGAVLPPFVGPGAQTLLQAGFDVLCHQAPARSFHFDGVSLAACHRCTGIFGGLVLGVLVLPLWLQVAGEGRYPRRRFFGTPALRSPDAAPIRARTSMEGWLMLAALLPAAVDWGGDVAGLWTNTVGTRVATGLWFGSLTGFVFARSLSATSARV